MLRLGVLLMLHLLDERLDKLARGERQERRS
jgi:hypothetical protein